MIFDQDGARLLPTDPQFGMRNGEVPSSRLFTGDFTSPGGDDPLCPEPVFDREAARTVIRVHMQAMGVPDSVPIRFDGDSLAPEGHDIVGVSPHHFAGGLALRPVTTTPHTGEML